jgi:hypothetical protein
MDRLSNLHKDASPTTQHARALDYYLLSALNRLRLSVWRGRTMSLPNLLRDFRRHWADTLAKVEDPALGKPSAARALMLMDTFYRCEQPFRTTDWRRARRWLRSVAEA